jgi:hypothetical protein
MSNAHDRANAHAQPGFAIVDTRRMQAPITTLLGRAAPRIPVAGRIRAGIKVLTRKAAEFDEARRLYEEGVAQGRGFESIEAAIAKALPDLKNPLTPKNVPYFTVRGEDFPNPEIARQIMELYAEDRGDGMRRLYRFPVVFPSDAWQNVMPHELVAWTTNERRFWSEYSEDGQTRRCMTHAPVPKAQGSQRAIRIFGGRKTVERADNGGVCNPESCLEYQERKCNLSGRFIFFVPGIKSLSAFELPTNSFYALNAAIQKFQTIGFMRGGRISGFLDNRQTPFFITKRLVEVPRIDDNGRSVRTQQWIIELEAPVDVTALLRTDDGLDGAVETRAAEALGMLEGDGGMVPDFVATEVVEPVAMNSPAADTAREPAASPARPGTPRANATAQRAASTATAATAQAADVAVADVVAAAVALGADAAQYEEYADRQWGAGWRMNPNGRRRALEEVSRYGGDAEGFKARIAAQQQIFN